MFGPKKTSTVRTRTVGGGLIAYDTATHESFVLNSTASLVFEHIDGALTEQELTDVLHAEFNLPEQQAAKLLMATLSELRGRGLIEGGRSSTTPVSRRRLLQSVTAAGIATVLLPVVTPFEAHAGTPSPKIVPKVNCVTDNGDGTYTADFGYINSSGAMLLLPVGPHNRFLPPSNPNRGQPAVFFPGTQEYVFSVTWNGVQPLTWKVKNHKKLHASATANPNDGSCIDPPTAPPTTIPPTTPFPTTDPPTTFPPTTPAPTTSPPTTFPPTTPAPTTSPPTTFPPTTPAPTTLPPATPPPTTPPP